MASRRPRSPAPPTSITADVVSLRRKAEERWRDEEEEISSGEQELLDSDDDEENEGHYDGRRERLGGNVSGREPRRVGRKRGSGGTVYRSVGKKGGKEINLHLSPRTKKLIIGGIVLVLICVGGWIAYAYGVDAVEDVKDFVIFPEVTTPLDVTSAVAGAWNDATGALGDFFGGLRPR